jgi:glycosyltransferase involved in cell wall biosynthesis
VLIEAMATGLPVVATASYGTRDIVQHERTGLLVERHDADAVADALERVLSDAGLRTRMSAAGRIRARDFSATAIVDRFDALLTSLLHECSPSAERLP